MHIEQNICLGELKPAFLDAIWLNRDIPFTILSSVAARLQIQIVTWSGRHSIAQVYFISNFLCFWSTYFFYMNITLNSHHERCALLNGHCFNRLVLLNIHCRHIHFLYCSLYSSHIAIILTKSKIKLTPHGRFANRFRWGVLQGDKSRGSQDGR